MSSENTQPFISKGAYYKATNSYVPFPSQSDAMLASLQLFHEVPCRIMNLIISVVTHPDFDSKQVTFESSLDVIKATEEARLQDRMAVVHGRSLNANGHMEQTAFPQFVLYQTLDIIHAERQESIRRLFEETLEDNSLLDVTRLFESISEDNVLSNMSLVHRSWTFPAQQTLGRIVCIGRAVGRMDFLSRSEHRAIFGPWTTTVAIGFLIPNQTYAPKQNVDREVIEYGLLQNFENLHRMLVSSPNLKHIYIRSYIPLFTKWFNFTVREMVRQSTHLEEVTLQRAYVEWSQVTGDRFNLDPIVENKNVSDNLRSLSIQGASFSDEVQNSSLKRASFARLRHLSFGSDLHTPSSTILLKLLHAISASPNAHLDSFNISGGTYKTFSTIEDNLSSEECTTLFDHLSTFRIDSREAYAWLRWISPYCARVENFAITTMPFGDLSSLLSPMPTTIQSLYLRIRHASFPEHLIRIRLGAGKLLKIVRSALYPTLKQITLKVSSVKQMKYPTEVQDAVDVYEAGMQEFVIEMNSACGDAGIEFSFSWGEQNEINETIEEIIDWDI